MEKPPSWQSVLAAEAKRFPELMMDQSVTEFIAKMNSEYLHWDRLRYQKLPKGLKPDLAWALVKIARRVTQDVLPIKNESQQPFSVFLTKKHLKALSYLDSYTSGAIVSEENLPGGMQKERLVINGLIEEAISSSQIEGANTTRKVAKEMIELKRKPATKSERMILNNYRAMSVLENWRDRPLDDKFMLELHRILSAGTMENSGDEGRFRVDADEVVVSDRVTGEIVHTPPMAADAKRLMTQLYAFANEDEEENYIHPFVKASILHFCIGYIHPFVDGNGRSARAVFYWYLLKKNYWMFKFLPISLQIKKKDWRSGYDRAFQQVETDEGDITYFLSYKLRLACNAIDDFRKYLNRKQRDSVALKERMVANDEINPRQLALIEFLRSHPAAHVDIEFHQEREHVVYQTARTDLLSLVSKKVLKKTKVGKKFVFVRGEKFPA